jgi:ribonuclease D
MNFSTSITKEEINLLPLLEYEGEAILIETDKGCVRAIGELIQEKVLGFDTETRPSFSKGEYHKCALLQLSGKKRAYLFRLNKISFTAELAALLANPEILKVGVAVHDDVKALQKLHPFDPAGFIDLNTVGEKNGIENLGLRSLSAIFLHKRLSKGAKLTNWDQDDLTRAQVEYAANDALVGLQIYEKMLEHNFKISIWKP